MTGDIGIIDYGAHIPYWRLRHDRIAEALGRTARSGARAVASYDEDTTTMAVEASRHALAGGLDPVEIDAVLLATTTPSYVDKTNATAIHAALGLSADAHAADMGGAVRSGTSALLSGLYRSGRALVALSDLRFGPSGSVDERSGGDAAAALVVGTAGSDPLIAQFLGVGSATAEFVDRWRAPGAPWSSHWEERFGEREYTSLAVRSFDNALKSAGLTVDDVGRVAVTGLAPRATRTFTKQAGIASRLLADDLTATIGNSGTAHPGILLASMLDAATPGQVLAITILCDGAETLIFRTTDAIVRERSRSTVADQIARGCDKLSYLDFLTWRGQVQRQPPRRPDPDRASAPASRRMADWKFGFTGSECIACDTRHLPPQKVCLRCGATDQMSPIRLADMPATVATYTVDHLAFSPAPPLVGAVIDFDDGGRFSCELTDLEPAKLAVGQRVEMTFRRLSTTDGIHNYFWKARPISEGHQR